MTTLFQQDISWKLQKITPEKPKKDGRAEEHLRKIGISSKQYTCDILVVVKTDICDVCSVCKQEDKTTKVCRIKQNGRCKDVAICPDCINVFVEYNPKSVYNFEAKETK